jgi:hypothetical protein
LRRLARHCRPVYPERIHFLRVSFVDILNGFNVGVIDDPDQPFIFGFLIGLCVVIGNKFPPGDQVVPDDVADNEPYQNRPVLQNNMHVSIKVVTMNVERIQRPVAFGGHAIAEQLQDLVDLVHSQRFLPLFEITDKPQPDPGLFCQLFLSELKLAAIVFHKTGKTGFL